MPKRRTWVWIVVSIVGVCIVGLIALAVAGMMFVSRNVTTSPANSADAQRAFETAKAPFKDAAPLLELDPDDRAKLRRPLSEFPTSAVKPTHMWILVWDDDDEQLVKISVPFWLLRFGGRNVQIGNRGGFDLEKLNLDANELERIGPALVLEHRTTSGERLLIWTQ